MNTTSLNNKLQPTTSVILDSLRIISALTVLFSHTSDQWFPSTQHKLTAGGTFAHAAVVVFFVLSGYVISYSTSINRSSLSEYFIARLSRLCSIVIPALFYTAIIQLIIGYLNPLVGKEYSRGYDGIRYLLASVFCNEIWFASAAPPLNRPLWSLSFEFWYYLIFGIWFYLMKLKMGRLILIFSILLAGPKILLMMPIWIYGCLAYKITPIKISKIIATSLILFSFFIGLILMLKLPPYPFSIGSKPFYFANQFLTDWLVGLFVAFGIWLLPKSLDLNISHSVLKKIRILADLTFPLYVLHFPTLILFKTIVTFKRNDLPQALMAICFVLIITIPVGLFLEYKRTNWKDFFNNIIKLFINKNVVNSNS